MSATTHDQHQHTDNNSTGVPPVPPEAHQKAARKSGKGQKQRREAQALTVIGKDCTVALNKLVLSKHNVRTKPGSVPSPEELEELAASIHANGLIHRLCIIEGEDGAFEVVAGGRRLHALGLLVAQGKLDASQEIDCRLYASAEAVAISLAENTGREEMHPADQYQAFRTMIETEKATLDAVAARYGISTLTVRRRLKLAGIAPALLDLYRDGEISQECLQALALEENHETQIHIWNTTQHWQRTAHGIRSRIAQEEISLGAGITLFVGADAYTAAGGEIRSDLFTDDGAGGFCRDGALLKRLASEKLAELGEAVRNETGWSWLDVSLGYRGHSGGYRVIQPTLRECTEEEAVRIAQLEEQHEAKSHECDETEDSDEHEQLWNALQGIERELVDIEAARKCFTEADKAAGGIVAALDEQGSPIYYAGRMRLASTTDSGASATGQVHVEAPTKKARAEFSERLMLDMTAHRTAALQAALLESPRVARVLMLHALCKQVLAFTGSTNPAEIRMTKSGHAVKSSASELDSSRAGVALAQAEAEWEAAVPFTDWGEEEALFDWLLAQDDALLDRLQAYLVACSMTAMTNEIGRRRNMTDKLAEAMGFDMADWWEPRSANYFSHIGKPKIAEAVATVKGASAGAALMTLKKGEAAAQAEQLMAGSRWLPSPLLSVSVPESAPDADEESREEE